jgi:serine/threonine-protein kinase
MLDPPWRDGETEEQAVVHRLLAVYADDRAGGRVRSLAEYQAMFPGHVEVVAAELASLDTDVRDGDARVGAYRLVRELGRGGQATVWLAQDTRLPRRVALKVLRRGPSTRAREQRLRREAAATAQLEDPGICQIYEVGEDQGDAWIAMRFVSGTTLAEHIRLARDEKAPARSSDRGGDTSRPARVLEVVQLFERVARSVHRAHQAGIVHRDLKPANIMVSDDGTPVVLDFGLAHAERDATTLTLEGEVFGTPAYMAPEQVRGAGPGVDARCDVYALGISLFEALALRRPFDAPTHEATFAQVLRGEPPPLRRLNPAVSRDLAVVVATAMEVDAARRYRTALDLAEDLRAVRVHEPIRARPPGPLRKTLQFARRHRTAAAVMAMLLVTSCVTLALALGLDRARREAEAHGAVAAAVNRFMVDVFAQANPAVNPLGRTPTAPELLTLAEREVENALAEQPRSRAAVYAMLGRSSAALGGYDRGREHLQRALDLRLQTPGVSEQEVVDTFLGLADVYCATQDLEAAEAALAEAARRGGWSADDHSDQRLDYEYERMVLAVARGDHRAARAVAEEMVRVLVLGRTPSDPRLLSTRIALGGILTQLGEYDAAAATFASCRGQHGDKMDSERATLLLNEAALEWRRGRPEAAMAGFRAALAIQRRSFGDRTNVVAGSLINLGVASRQLGEHEQARQCYEEALSILLELHGEEHGLVAIARTNLARVLEDTGHLDEAIAMHRAALATHAALGGERSQDWLTCKHNLAGALLARGETAAARSMFADVVERRRALLGDAHPEVADSLVGLGRAATLIDPAAAEPAFREAVATYRAALGGDDDRTIDAEVGLAHALVEMGGEHRAAAEDLALALHARLEAMTPPRDVFAKAVARLLANLFAATQRAEEAAAWRERAR